MFKWVLGVRLRYEEICISNNLPAYSMENSVGSQQNSSRRVRRLLQDPMERCQWLGLERRDKGMERYLAGKLIG